MQFRWHAALFESHLWCGFISSFSVAVSSVYSVHRINSHGSITLWFVDMIRVDELFSTNVLFSQKLARWSNNATAIKGIIWTHCTDYTIRMQMHSISWRFVHLGVQMTARNFIISSTLLLEKMKTRISKVFLAFHCPLCSTLFPSPLRCVQFRTIWTHFKVSSGTIPLRQADDPIPLLFCDTNVLSTLGTVNTHDGDRPLFSCLHWKKKLSLS